MPSLLVFGTLIESSVGQQSASEGFHNLKKNGSNKIKLVSWEPKVPPPMPPLVSLNKALLGPYFLGGVALGGVP